MRYVHVPRGLQASGKSTLSRRLAANGAVHVELDVIRRRVWPDCPPSWDPYTGRGLAVQDAFEAEVAGWLAAGRDVVADRTHLDVRGLRRLERLVGGRAEFVIHDLTQVPLDLCITRDALRPDEQRVGEHGIRALHDRWIATYRYLHWRNPDAA